jgi:Fe-Mn family superoxide dismutase
MSQYFAIIKFLAKYMFKLPVLEYELYELQPFMSPFLLYTHYYRHHKKYLDTLNMLLIDNRKYENKNILQIIFESKKNNDNKIFNNACQHYNHSFFWMSITPLKLNIPSELEQNIIYSFKSIPNFKKKLIDTAKSLFGSGYMFIVIPTKQTHTHLNLEIITTKDADVPQLYGYHPICNLDLWEHSYYLDYLFQRDKYIEEFYNFINWNFVYENYKKIKEYLE